MDELRLSLLALFVALIAGIYIRERLRRKRDLLAHTGTLVSSTDTLDGAVSPHSTSSVKGAGERPSQSADGGAKQATPRPSSAASVNDMPGGGNTEFGSLAKSDGLDIPLGNIDLLTATRSGNAVSRHGQLDLELDAQTADACAHARGDGETLIVVLHVMSEDGEPMPGPRVQSALARAGLRFGQMGVYHHYGVDHHGDVSAPVFSVARAIEPGTFVEHDEASYATPGVTLFMSLPGVQDGAVILELMFAAAQSLARDLNAKVLDDQRSSLSAQVLNHLRDRVNDFSRRQRLATGIENG